MKNKIKKMMNQFHRYYMILYFVIICIVLFVVFLYEEIKNSFKQNQ